MGIPGTRREFREFFWRAARDGKKRISCIFQHIGKVCLKIYTLTMTGADFPSLRGL
jgi:hypothetical protein